MRPEKFRQSISSRPLWANPPQRFDQRSTGKLWSKAPGPRPYWAYKQNGPSLPRYIPHFTQALLLKRDIAHREHFIDDENLGSKCAATAKAKRTYIPLE